MCFNLNIFNLCVSSSNNSSQSKQETTSTSTHNKTSHTNRTSKKIKVAIKKEANIKIKALSPSLSSSSSSSFTSSIQANKEKQNKNLRNQSKIRLVERPNHHSTSWRKKLTFFTKSKSNKNKYQIKKEENLRESIEIENKQENGLRNSQKPDKTSDTDLLLFTENSSKRAIDSVEYKEFLLPKEHPTQTNKSNQIFKSPTAYSFNSATSLSPLTPRLQKSPLASLSSSLNHNCEFNHHNDIDSYDKQSTSSSSSTLSNHSFSRSFKMDVNKKDLNSQENNQSRTNENIPHFIPNTDKNQNNKMSNEAMNLPFLFSSPKLKRTDQVNTTGLESSFKVQLDFKQNETPELRLETMQTKKQAFYFNDNKLFSKPNELFREDTQLSSILDDELSSARLEVELNDSNKNKTHKSPHHDYKYYQKHHYPRVNEHSKIFSKGGKITISPEQVYEFKESDFEEIRQIGNGEFGTVLKVLHKPSHTYMALKRVGPTVGSQIERKKVLKELDFVLECEHHENIVIFYGVKLNNEPADCLICMELMDTSLEKFYKFVYLQKHEEIPETILGKIVVATVNGLNYLKETHKIIHRDVKPSNILINQQGKIKICDFGISGKLVDSIAASRDAGCQLYMAPERIDPTRAAHFGYDVRSDVWSLGITLYELSTGKFPYPQWKTIFHQLNLVVENDAPRLESERLSHDFKDFVNTCLTKNDANRPKYRELMQHRLIETHLRSNANCADYFKPYILEMESIN